MDKDGWKIDSRLKESKATEWLVLLGEELREFQRLSSTTHAAQYSRLLDEILKNSIKLSKAVDNQNDGQASQLMKRIKQNCISCHKRFRD